VTITATAPDDDYCETFGMRMQFLVTMREIAVASTKNKCESGGFPRDLAGNSNIFHGDFVAETRTNNYNTTSRPRVLFR